jgi:hypothetical protein
MAMVNRKTLTHGRLTADCAEVAMLNTHSGQVTDGDPILALDLIANLHIGPPLARVTLALKSATLLTLMRVAIRPGAVPVELTQRLLGLAG